MIKIDRNCVPTGYGAFNATNRWYQCQCYHRHLAVDTLHLSAKIDDPFGAVRHSWPPITAPETGDAEPQCSTNLATRNKANIMFTQTRTPTHLPPSERRSGIDIYHCWTVRVFTRLRQYRVAAVVTGKLGCHHRDPENGSWNCPPLFEDTFHILADCILGYIGDQLTDDVLYTSAHSQTCGGYLVVPFERVWVWKISTARGHSHVGQPRTWCPSVSWISR